MISNDNDDEIDAVRTYNDANKSAHKVDDKDCKESVNSLHFNDV